jgi:hypothetical protein
VSNTSAALLSNDFIYGQSASTVFVSPGNFGVLVLANKMWLIPDGGAVVDESNTSVPVKYNMDVNWFKLLDQYGEFRAGGSRIYLTKVDGTEIVGTGAVDISNEAVMLVNWDPDTFPTNTIIDGRGTIDAIVNPLTYNPSNAVSGVRYLILESIGSIINQDGAAGWKQSNGNDFVALENDIITWDGNNWSVIFPAKTVSDVVYVTNLKTNIQYKWDGEYWTKSFDGEYMSGKWRIAL